MSATIDPSPKRRYELRRQAQYRRRTQEAYGYSMDVRGVARMTQAQAAEIMGITEDGVRKHERMALHKIRADREAMRLFAEYLQEGGGGDGSLLAEELREDPGEVLLGMLMELARWWDMVEALSVNGLQNEMRELEGLVAQAHAALAQELN